MSDKKKAYLRLMPVALLFAALCVFAWGKSADDFSLSERRPLAQMPELNADEVLSGDFISRITPPTSSPCGSPSASCSPSCSFICWGRRTSTTSISPRVLPPRSKIR